MQRAQEMNDALQTTCMSQLRLKLQSKDSSEAFNMRGVFSRGYLGSWFRAELDRS